MGDPVSAWTVLATWLVPAAVGLVQGYRLAHRDQGAVIVYLRNHVAVVTAERDEARAFLAWDRQVSS